MACANVSTPKVGWCQGEPQQWMFCQLANRSTSAFPNWVQSAATPLGVASTHLSWGQRPGSPDPGHVECSKTTGTLRPITTGSPPTEMWRGLHPACGCRPLWCSCQSSPTHASLEPQVWHWTQWGSWWQMMWEPPIAQVFLHWWGNCLYRPALVLLGI